jgi:hypothetical protein
MTILELPEILKWVDKGAQVHPLSLFKGVDDSETDHHVVFSDMFYQSNVVIQHNNKFCFTKQNSWRIPSKVMNKPQVFSAVAQGNLQSQSFTYS